MKTFALDIWTDLREKRLWPVAVALLVGLVAVPVVLSKPAEEPPPADPVSAPGPPAAAASATGQPLPAQLEAAKPLLQTSTLSDFQSTKDPFKPLKALASVEQQAGVQATEEAKPDVSGGGGETGGGETGGDTGGGGGGGQAPSGKEEEEKTVFTYQAVVELTTASGTKKRVVNRLGLLPKDTNPLLVFLGVSADNTGEAVFLVDSTVTQAGEGRCRPSNATCSFLYLTSDEGQDEHIFTTDDGKEYGIKLLQIRRVEVKESNAPTSAGDPVAKVGSATTSVTTTDAVGATDAAALGEPVETSVEATAEDTVDNPFAGFGFPLFADEVE